MKNDLIWWTWLKKESLLEDMITETSKTKKQRAKDWKKQNRTFKKCATTTKGIHNGNTRKKSKRKRNTNNFKQ